MVATTFLAAGAEAPIEADPANKHCLQRRSPLETSVLWELQQCYYEALGEEAWSEDVPSFASSNAKLAQDYARIIFHFLRDTFAHDPSGGTSPSQEPVLIFEVGAGHGRFTFLVLQCLLRFQPHFEPLGLPRRPFLFFFTDFASSNVEACSSHPDLQAFVRDGWLAFAPLDANVPPGPAELRELATKHGISESATEVPIVVICNYLIDSLVQEALRFTAGPPASVSRGLLSVFSPREETTFVDPTLNSRLSFAWDWEDSPALLSASRDWGDCPSMLSADANEGLLAVVRAYLALKRDMTVVVPLGAFRIVEALKSLSGSRLLMLAGDKGHNDASEFVGHQTPHIAVHGSFSFMVNFDALRIYFEHYGGFAYQTPYHDAFQVGAFVLKPRSAYPSLLASLKESRCDFGPGTMLQWSRQLIADSEQVLPPHVSGVQPDAIMKAVMGLLRYSGHDPDIFWQFRTMILSQCSLVHLNFRATKDLATDLSLVYANRFRMGTSQDEDSDLAFAIGECLAKMGWVGQAADFFQRSIQDRGPHLNTWLHLATCLQSCGRIEEAAVAAKEAASLDPSSAPAVALRQNIEMYANSLGTAFVGAGASLSEQTGPIIIRDPRFQVRVVFAFGEEEALTMAASVERWRQVLRLAGEESAGHIAADTAARAGAKPDVLWGSSGLQALLQRDDVSVCIVDVHRQLMPGLLPKIWEAGKHVLSHSPLGHDSKSARSLLASYQAAHPRPAWHVVESARFEEGLEVAAESLAKLGGLRCISMTVATPDAASTNVSGAKATRPSQEERLTLELVHSLVTVAQVARSRIAAISVQLAEPDGPASSALVGHFTFQAKGQTDKKVTSTGGFLICSGTAYRFEIRFGCAHGWLTLRLDQAAWNITICDSKAGQQLLERSVPCVGHGSSHLSFLEQAQRETLRPASADVAAPRDVDVSVMHALADTALFESAIRSIRSGGTSLTFKYSS